MVRARVAPVDWLVRLPHYSMWFGKSAWLERQGDRHCTNVLKPALLLDGSVHQAGNHDRSTATSAFYISASRLFVGIKIICRVPSPLSPGRRGENCAARGAGPAPPRSPAPGPFAPAPPPLPTGRSFQDRAARGAGPTPPHSPAPGRFASVPPPLLPGR